MAMLRHRAAVASRVRTVLVYSSRSFEEIIYREELERLAGANDGLRVVHTLTRSQPEGWTGLSRRVDRAMLADVGFPPGASPHVFICGPGGLVESAGQLLIELGHDASRIKTERFGPSS
jgi:ferredoxin-NADP reductase